MLVLSFLPVEELEQNYSAVCDVMHLFPFFILFFCSAQSSEMQLLGEAKRCQAELERLQVEVRSPEEQRGPPEEPDGEVSKLRRQLLQAHNELRAAEDREHAARHGLQR